MIGRSKVCLKTGFSTSFFFLKRKTGTVLAALKVLRILLINQIPGHSLTQLHQTVVRKDSGAGKAGWKVMECNLFTSSSIHSRSQVQGFFSNSCIFFASIILDITR